MPSDGTDDMKADDGEMLEVWFVPAAETARLTGATGPTLVTRFPARCRAEVQAYIEAMDSRQNPPGRHEIRPPGVDHRALLAKYIRHVIDCEGVSFIDDSGAHSDVAFTADEMAELAKLKAEAADP